MITRILFLAVLTLACRISAAQNSFKDKVDVFLHQPEYEQATAGMSVVDLATGKQIYGLNEDQLMIPASTMKLITSAAALEILGSDYRFKTVIAYEGKLAENGQLDGNLILKGGADPALGSEYFQDHYFQFLQNWARRIKANGITRVKGDLVLDASVYDSENVPATWIWEDLGNYYGAGAAAFTVYDNIFRITFRSPDRAGEPTTVIGIYPKTEGLQLTNEVLSSDDNSDNAYVFGSPLDKKRVIRGTIPKNRKAFTIRASMPDPGTVLATDLLKELEKQGVFVSGSIRLGKAGSNDLHEIFVQTSPTLAEITRVLNYESVNLFAEHFLKQLSVEKYGQGNREKGIVLVQEFWEHKIPGEHFFMEDGSGLSHFDAVSPAFFTRLLRVMAGNKAFVQSLPVAGKGTLAAFDTNLFPGESLQAKSGSMTRVRCYSGYLTSDSGKKLAFSIMVNHFSGSHSALVKEIEELLLVLKATN